MAFSDPRKIIEELRLLEGMRVADFGSGSGHFSFAAAREVGEEGRVYAIEIQKELLARLKGDAEREGLSNIDVIWGTIDEEGGSRLAPESVDVVIFANVLFQIEHRRQAIEEGMRVLKSKGMALVVDWVDSMGGMGPQPENVFYKETARELFESVGFSFGRKIQNPGDHHYGLIFHKP